MAIRDGSMTLAEQAYSPVMFARSVRQAVAAGRTSILVPLELLVRPPDAPTVERLLGPIASLCWADIHFPEQRCIAICLQPGSHRSQPHAPTVDGRAAAAALREQMDPDKRLERRIAFELDQLATEGMPAASDDPFDALEVIYGAR